MKSKSIKSMTVLALTLALVAFGRSQPAFSEEATATYTDQAAAGPTDPQIAAIVVAANTVDIDAGKVGKSSKNKKVQKLAKQMIADHQSVNKQATTLVKKLNVTPEENDTSKSLKEGGKENLANLKKLNGSEFDKAYVDHEVAYYQQVLDTIDKTLLPHARNGELKALLEKVRPAIEAHLQHAQRIQSSMNKT